jgi:hypothetical protein
MGKDLEYYKLMFVNKTALSLENIEDIQKAGQWLVGFSEESLRIEDKLRDLILQRDKKIQRYEQIFDDIINHKEIFGYTPTHTRCANIAKQALELYKD